MLENGEWFLMVFPVFGNGGSTRSTCFFATPVLSKRKEPLATYSKNHESCVFFFIVHLFLFVHFQLSFARKDSILLNPRLLVTLQSSVLIVVVQHGGSPEALGKKKSKINKSYVNKRE